MSKYKVGDTFYAAPMQRHAAPAHLTVSKVGRKWMTLTSENGYEWGRCDIETLKIDSGGYNPRHALFESEDAYERYAKRERSWSSIQKFAREKYGCPEHLSQGDLDLIIALLTAQAIEARSGETGTGSTEGESAVRKDAPND